MNRVIDPQKDRTPGQGKYRWRCVRCQSIIFYRDEAQPEEDGTVCDKCWRPKKILGEGWDYYENKPIGW